MKDRYYALLEEIKNFFRRAHRKKAVVGLSGGIDSALTLKLVADAVGAKNVTAVLMPEKGLTRKKNMDDASDWARMLRVRTHLVEINPFLKVYENLPWKQSKDALMNTKARIRAVLLYNYANSNKAIVCGTSNRSELMLGYGTKYGDLASDVLVIGSLLKTEVYALARYLKLPEAILRKKPSAELAVGQTDEADLGASYAKLDVILRKVIEGVKLNKKDNLIKKTLQRVEKHKHKAEGPRPLEE